MTFVSRMSEMQRQALIYICSGHDAAGDRVGEIYSGMMEGVGQVQGVGQLDVDSSLGVTKKYLRSYYDTFQEVRKQREIQRRLVRKEFRMYATEAQERIEERIAALQEKNTDRTLQYYRMLHSLLQIEKNAYRYFDSLDSSVIQAAIQHIRATGQVIHTLEMQPGTDREKLLALAAVLDRYESSFREAVQRTRGYLYLVNVVMAAQAYETVYQAKRLSAMISEKSGQI
ncbi:MAG: hypothetical protein ACL93V_10780 [Candidatus Electrothrix sp. YB6]